MLFCRIETIHNILTKKHLVSVALDGIGLNIALVLVILPDRNKLRSRFADYLLDKKFEGIYSRK